ncbi:MAG: MATE family efflux transporter [Polyangiaceae bacterium]
MTPLESLHWKHKPIPELLRLAWPTAISMLSFSVQTLVDTLFVGRLGARELGAVSLGGVVAFTLICFGFGLLRSTKVVVSHAVGAGDGDRVGEIARAGAWLAVGLGLLTVTLGRWVVTHVPSLGPDAASGALAAHYVSIRNLGAVTFLVACALREALYGTGNARIPLRAALAANATNVGLDALLIFGFDLGVAGAAWATVGATVVECVVLLAALPNARALLAPPRGREVAELLRLGAPLGAQFVLEVGSFAVMVALLARTGDAQLAAHQIALQLTHFSFLPALAVGEAASILAGQAVGGRKYALVNTVSRGALRVAWVYSGSCGVLFILGSRVIPAWFSADAEVQEITTRLLWIAAAFQLTDAAHAVARSVLRGTGDVRFPAVLSVVTTWIVLPTSTWLLGIALGWGAVGAWLGLSFEIGMGAGLLWWRLARGRWRLVALRQRREARRRTPSVAAA